ncbi:MAG: hypothetical protein ACYDHD_00170 [Vulcanimicrobiaceae bacterium]
MNVERRTMHDGLTPEEIAASRAVFEAYLTAPDDATVMHLPPHFDDDLDAVSDEDAEKWVAWVTARRVLECAVDDYLAVLGMKERPPGVFAPTMQDLGDLADVSLRACGAHERLRELPHGSETDRYVRAAAIYQACLLLALGCVATKR